VDFVYGLVRLFPRCPAAWQHYSDALRSSEPVVAHDERTRELAETLALPYLVLDEFLALRSLSDARVFVATRLDAYWARRAILTERFLVLLRNNGIEVAFPQVREAAHVTC
jgi:hypothetical protein